MAPNDLRRATPPAPTRDFVESGSRGRQGADGSRRPGGPPNGIPLPSPVRTGRAAARPSCRMPRHTPSPRFPPRTPCARRAVHPHDSDPRLVPSASPRPRRTAARPLVCGKS